jgi:hypothetical protein
MNARIKELAKEARLLTGWPVGEVEYQKFAELIVKECVERASIGNGHGNNQWDRALTFAAKNIKQHFGVEE